jgi:endonuclease YncB( thermonuclease family)
LYLAALALVGVVTIGVFFGLGFYSLELATAEDLPDPRIRQEAGPAQASAKSDTPSPTGEFSAHSGIPQSNRETTSSEQAEPPANRNPEQSKFGNPSGDTLSGTVSEAADAMTWVVANNTVRLWGIRPGLHGLAPSLVSFVEWVRARGPLECRKHAHSNRYRCITRAGEDLAEAALLAGLGRAAEGASLAYRDAEAKARRRGKGLWAKL